MSIVNDKTIHKSRPPEKRTAVEEKTYSFLDSHNIRFERIDHAPANTIEECHEIEKYLNAEICKNLFLRNSAKTQFYLLIMRGDKNFVSSDISKKLNSTRLSFASPVDMKQYLDLTPGSVSIMGILNDTENNVILVIDKDLQQDKYFCCHPCKNTSTLKLSTEDIFNVFIPATGHNYKIIDV